MEHDLINVHPKMSKLICSEMKNRVQKSDNGCQSQPAVAMSTGQFGQFNGGFQQQQQQQTPQWAPTAQPNRKLVRAY